MKTALKLGDKVTADYGNVTVQGIVEGFGGGWTFLKFESPQDLGNRTETDGVGIRPSDRASIKLVESGPAVTEDQVVRLPASASGSVWLRPERA